MLSKTILVKMLEIVLIFEMVIKILLFKVCKLINVKFSCVLMHHMAKTQCANDCFRLTDLMNLTKQSRRPLRKTSKKQKAEVGRMFMSDNV